MKSTAMPARRSLTCSRAFAPQLSPANRRAARRWRTQRRRTGDRRGYRSLLRRVYAPTTRRWSSPEMSTTDGLCQGPRFFGAIPLRSCPVWSELNPRPAPETTVEAQFPFPFEFSISHTRFPATRSTGSRDQHAGNAARESAFSFYKALIESNIALAIETDADTQLKGGLLHIFIVSTQAMPAAKLHQSLQRRSIPCSVTVSIRISSSRRNA